MADKKKVIVFIPVAGYRPWAQMIEAYQNAKNYYFSTRPDVDFREYFCYHFPIHANRNLCAGLAIEGFTDEDGSKWLPDITVWIDADTVIPYDALYRLISPEHKVVTGIYRLKKWPFHPLTFLRWKYDEAADIWIYRPWIEHPIEEEFKLDSAGMGCVRVDTEVLKALKPPHFKYQLPSHLEGPVNQYPGEDADFRKQSMDFLIKYHVYTNTEEAWFWRQVIDQGFEIWCDPKINCKHMAEVAIDDEYAMGIKVNV